MAPHSTLRKEISELLKRNAEGRESRTTARRQEMMDLAARKAHFEKTARGCLAEIVVPRLETLRQELGNANAVQTSTDGMNLCLGLRSSASYPIGADLTVTTGHDRDLRTLEISWKVSIIPILTEYDREASLALDLDSPDKERFGRFVDERILRFVSDYLRIHEPGSPYLKLAEVRDPVCGMTFPASEAASSLTVGHETYYFCAEECAAAFEGNRHR